MESATAWPFARLRVASTTLAPDLANSRAMPSPMPWPAPLTMATLPDRSTIMIDSPCSREPQPRRLQPYELDDQQRDCSDGDLQGAHLKLVTRHHHGER